MVKCFRSILLLGLILIFNTILSTAQVNGGALEDGEAVEIEVDGVEELVFTYLGAAGDVISVFVIAQNDTDTRIVLYNTDGEEIASDDNSGEFLNPALIRIELADAGEYTISIKEYSEGVLLEDEFEVVLYQVDLLDLNAAPQTSTLDGTIELDRMVFDAQAETSYDIIVSIEDSYNSILYIHIFDESDPFAIAELKLTGLQDATFRFVPENDALITFELEYFGFNETVQVTIEIEETK